MRLVCLECSAAYEAPDSLFGPQPREVRCNRCGYQWTVVGSRVDDNSGPAALSIGPAEGPAAPPVQAPELPRPLTAMARPPMMEPLAASPSPPQAPPPRRTASLADTLAGPPPPDESFTPAEGSRPLPAVEPAAESTRALLSMTPGTEMVISPPDPEERRLSHELDFGGAERHRRNGSGSGGGTRRVVIILILLILVAAIVAVIFKTQIVAVVPALDPLYAQLGL